jgi:hypothetical protein
MVLKNLLNIPGWSTKRKLIVIESDDWGSIRMPSINSFTNLTNAGIDLLSDEGSRFNKYDSLATSDDLLSLFDLLNSVKDSTGRPPVITPVSVVANPDFRKIEDSSFNEYFYEPFTETLAKYPGCKNSFELWKEGITHRLFVPQFHGREHLNVRVWLKALQARHMEISLAFRNNMWGLSTIDDPQIKVEVQAAFDFSDPGDLVYQKEVIKTGLDLFEKLFGYRAVFFVPPNGPFSSKLENTCANSGIIFISFAKIQKEPVGYNKTRRRFHWLGQKTGSGIVCLTRNCFFEPSQTGQDWVDSCLYDISNSFRWKKPAVISSHRVNYIGALHESNRSTGLRQLHLLLKNIIKKWPSSEFITSAELGNIIMEDRDAEKT